MNQDATVRTDASKTKEPAEDTFETGGFIRQDFHESLLGRLHIGALPKSPTLSFHSPGGMASARIPGLSIR